MDDTAGLLCVGLDPDLEQFPAPLQRFTDVEEAIVRFNVGIIEATADLACVYKPNLGFYLAHGVPGLRALERTRALLPPATPAILDAKIGDIGSTAAAYARGVFDALGFDAVTVNPYLGEDALEPFLARPDHGIFVLCKTSNPGSADFQDLPVTDDCGAGPLHGTPPTRRRLAWSWAPPTPASWRPSAKLAPTSRSSCQVSVPRAAISRPLSAPASMPGVAALSPPPPARSFTQEAETTGSNARGKPRSHYAPRSMTLDTPMPLDRR
jgi:hypothetical protein